jgi:hypothetical protein
LFKTLKNRQEELNTLINNNCEMKHSVQLILNIIKKYDGVPFEDVNMSNWYQTKYIKNIKKIHSKTKINMSYNYVIPSNLKISFSDHSTSDNIETYFKLFEAVYTDDIDDVLEIIKSNKDIKLDVSIESFSLMDIAIIGKNDSMVQELLKLYAERSMHGTNLLYWISTYSNDRSMIHSLIKYNLLSSIRYIITTFPQSFWITYYYNTNDNIIEYTIKRGRLDALKCLLVTINKDYSYNIFEQCAQCCKDPIMMEYILTDVVNNWKVVCHNKDNKQLCTAWNSNIPFLNIFIERQEENDDTVKCLNIVLKYRKQDLINNPSIIHYTVKNSKLRFARVCIKFCEDNELYDVLTYVHNGYTIDMIFMQEDEDIKSYEDIKIFSNLDYNKQIQLSLSSTMYHVAAYLGITDPLLSTETPYTHRDILGNNILHYMCYSGQYDTLKKLIQKYGTRYGKQITKMFYTENIFGYTPVDVAYSFYLTPLQTNIMNTEMQVNLLNLIRMLKLETKSSQYIRDAPEFQVINNGIHALLNMINNDQYEKICHDILPLYE